MDTNKLLDIRIIFQKTNQYTRIKKFKRPKKFQGWTTFMTNCKESVRFKETTQREYKSLY